MGLAVRAGGVCVRARGPGGSNRAPPQSAHYVYILHDIVDARDGELTVKRGDRVRILDDHSDDWYGRVQGGGRERGLGRG